MRNQKNKLQHTAIAIANITMFFVQGPRCSSLAVINPSTASRNLLSVTNPSWETFVPRKSWMITRGSFCSGLARKTRTATCRSANAPKHKFATDNTPVFLGGAPELRPVVELLQSMKEAINNNHNQLTTHVRLLDGKIGRLEAEVKGLQVRHLCFWFLS